MSSGRTFSVKTGGVNATTSLVSLTPDVSGAEATKDRWAINVVNTDATNTVNVGRLGEAAIPLTPAVAYRFEGCAYADLVVNDLGNSVVLAVDGSDTIEERGRALGLKG